MTGLLINACQSNEAFKRNKTCQVDEVPPALNGLPAQRGLPTRRGKPAEPSFAIATMPAREIRPEACIRNEAFQKKGNMLLKRGLPSL
jgi:hypothetical protein